MTARKNGFYKGSFTLAFAVFLFMVFFAGMNKALAVTTPDVIGDNMVLQQNKVLPIWGWAEPGEKIKVTFEKQERTTVSDREGNWMVKLDPVQAGGPFEMTIEGKNKIIMKNILVGEVWLAGGQSNMRMNVGGVENAKEEIKNADYPKIRLFVTRYACMEVPQKNISLWYDYLQETVKPLDLMQYLWKFYGVKTPMDGKWVECSSQTVKDFSAAGYFFGRKVHEETSFPVGLIQSCWGATAIEAWISKSSLESDPALKDIVDRREKLLNDYPQAISAYYKEMANYIKMKGEMPDPKNGSANTIAGKTLSPPKVPVGPAQKTAIAQAGVDYYTNTIEYRILLGNYVFPTGMYNGMIEPIIPYAIQGVIWYQGESNVGNQKQYKTLFPLLIKSWRSAWNQGDFPFLFVQLANVGASREKPASSSWAALREAQTTGLAVPKTGMAVAIDIGDTDVHAKNKQDVGLRLALWALGNTYKQKVVYSGPLYEKMEIENNQIRLYFKNIGGGLVAKGGDVLKQFAIADDGKVFEWADARIDGNTVVVWSTTIANPVAVRYAWADNPEGCNLYNKEGLPASPFRTDDWQ
ncbi:MAG: sialate O-acetylesterase [Victivallales bacterium]